MLSIITAYGRNREIGTKSGLPWGKSLPTDLEWLRQHTDHKTIIIGRVTYQISKQLHTNQQVYILTRGLNKSKRPNEHFIKHIEALADLHNSDEEIFVLGGAKVYTALLPYCQKLYITEVDSDFADADSFFPAFDNKKYNLEYSKHVEADSHNKYSFTFKILSLKSDPKELSDDS